MATDQRDGALPQRSTDDTFRQVADLAATGEYASARELLDQVAAEHLASAPLDAARALRLGAGVSRLLADPHGQLDRAERAIGLAAGSSDGDPDVVAAALVEVGEAQRALGDAVAAAHAFDRLASDPGRSPDERLAARLRQADALGAAGQLDSAVGLLRRAAEEALRDDKPDDAAAALVHGATLAQAGGRSELLGALESAARAAASMSGSAAALADLDLLTAARALGRRDLPATRTAAAAARAHALQAVQPLAYLAAVLTGSRVADRMGDRRDAYRLLATGYVTLADLLGADLARHTFEPELLALRSKWGAPAFAAVKAEHDAARRAERSQEG